ncbi:MAG TPA: beta-propeller fold lactonase family protein [Bryobacteraceae bacterium]|nr:beta-propeller fold lactonase family protein [Bryobacteraceae bacterium]
MQFRSRSASLLILVSFLLQAAFAQTAGPSFGGVVSLGGTPSDAVLDEARGRLYLVNSSAGRIDVYDYAAKSVTGSIQVGTFPLSAAMSPDGAFLYVTNTQSSSLSVIDLGSNSVTETASLPAKPEGVAVGADGRVLITTQGAGVNNQSNTLLIFDRTQQQGQKLTPVASPPAISTPAPLPALFLGRPATQFPGRLLATPDAQFIVGMVAINQTTNAANTTLFVYEAASGVVLTNRTVTGQSTVLSMSPDGSRFMAGSTLYETATLNVIAQQNTANLPFFIGNGTNPNFNIQSNFGGSVFSPDGSTIYSAFNTSGQGIRPVANVLYISSSQHLGVKLGVRMPQSILGKMVMTSDGEHLFAISESGLIAMPIGALHERPILQPETTQVFLAIDECNKGLAKTSVKVANLGKGKLTFSVPTVTTALVTQQSTGVVPANLDLIMEPGRSGVVRQPGTNLFTNAGQGGGAPINVTLLSSEAINYPNTIRVYMNYRQSDQRGIIYPRPVSLNNGQGLQELLVDEQRGRVYISNAGYNRIEVFDTQKQRFLNPIEVGQLPRSMAMSGDGNFLYVGNTGGESISIVDLDTQAIAGQLKFPPIPRAGNQNSIQPTALGMGLSGLQFMMSNGTFWHVIGDQATPRIANSVTPVSIPGPQYMAASPGGEYILTVAGNGNAYLYDASIDTYTAARQLFDQTPVSYFGPIAAAQKGSYFVFGGLTLSSALSVIGGAERPGQTQFGPPPAPGQPPTQTIVSAGLRNVASIYPIDENTFVRLTTPVRQNTTSVTRDDARPTIELVDIRTGSESVVGIAPDNPVQSVFGANRVNVPSRQLAVDSKGTAYAITLSGLSVIPLTSSGTSSRPQITAGTRGIVNSSDGTPNFKPGSFITVSGANLATAATADQIPAPTVMGGSCVVFNDVAIPLLKTASGQISAQIPADIRPGQNVVQVRSLATAQSSDPFVVTVLKP